MVDSKIKSKMNMYDRRLLVRKIIPYLFISCAIWTFSCYIFGFLVEYEYIFTIMSAPTLYALGIVFPIILFIPAIYLSLKGHNSSAFVLYLGLSFTSGIIPTLLLYVMRFSGFLYIVFCVGIIPFTVIFLLTGILGRYYYSKNTRILQIILSFIMTAGPVVLFNIFFKLDDNIYYLIASGLISFYVLILITIYSAKVSGNYKKNSWMLFLMRVSLIFLLSLVLIGIIIGTIALIILDAQGDIDLDIGGVGGIFDGGGLRKKKKNSGFIYKLFYYVPIAPIVTLGVAASSSHVASKKNSQQVMKIDQLPPKDSPQNINKVIEKQIPKICSYCGFENKINSKFCGYCGFKI